MAHDEARLEQLCSVADRFDDLADTAELMGDEAGAQRFRSAAAARRAIALTMLDGDQRWPSS